MKRHFRWLYLFLLMLLWQGWAQEVRYGSLPLLISQIRSAMPGQNSEAFVIPTLAQMDSFRAVTNLVIAGEYHLADSLAGMLDYALYEWYDTSSGNTLYYVLMEPNANQSGGVKLGWGSFVFYPEGDSEVIIEVPHPYYDTNTWKVGFAAYQELETRFFLMAGTHRYANGTNPRPADVAHNTQNMFHVVHQQTAPLCSHALQVHGFSRSGHPGYPDIVLSNGTTNPGMIVDSLAAELAGFGYTYGIFDGIHWTDLGATTNTQGVWSNGNGYSFLHMETEYFIRASQSEWENVVEALYNIFRKPLSIPYTSGIAQPQTVELLPNYPNPFNSATQIDFFLPKQRPVHIVVLNVLGQEVRRIDSPMHSPGWHHLVIEMKDQRQRQLPAGIYFCRISSDDFAKTIKMMYVP